MHIYIIHFNQDFTFSFTSQESSILQLHLEHCCLQKGISDRPIYQVCARLCLRPPGRLRAEREPLPLRTSILQLLLKHCCLQTSSSESGCSRAVFSHYI